MHRLTQAAMVATAVVALAVAGCSKDRAAEHSPDPQNAGDPGKPVAADSAGETAPAVTGSPSGESLSAAKAGPTKSTAAATVIAVGTVAPDFTAEAHDGTTIQMSALKGQPVVLYFYPRDDTPG